MPNYRRLFIPGGTFFFTANLLDRRARMLTENIDALRAAYGYAAKRYPFETLAICILPEHLHCVWRMPPGDHDYPLRWRLILHCADRDSSRVVKRRVQQPIFVLERSRSAQFGMIKSRFSKSLPRERDPRAGRRMGERGVWQRRFREHAIRDADDLGRHVDYIHWNPVRARLKTLLASAANGVFLWSDAHARQSARRFGPRNPPFSPDASVFSNGLSDTALSRRPKTGPFRHIMNGSENSVVR